MPIERFPHKESEFEKNYAGKTGINFIGLRETVKWENLTTKAMNTQIFSFQYIIDVEGKEFKKGGKNF